jgi:hypothetical protein
MTTLHASWMEILQLLTACIGMVLAMWSLWVAADDAIELTGYGVLRDLRRLVALGNLRGQMARCLAHSFLVAIGLVSVLLPPPPDVLASGRSLEEQDGFILVGLMLLTVLLTFDALMERRHRYVFMDHVARLEPVHVNPEPADA